MYYQRKQNKYKSVSTIVNGIQYHSKKEAAYAMELSLRKEAGDIKSWERQVKIDLSFHGKHVTNYYIDFVITHNDDSLEYVEVKGFETDVWRLKWRMFEILYDSHRLTVIK